MTDERILMLDESIRVIQWGLQKTKTRLLDEIRADPKFAEDVKEVDDMIETVLERLFK